MTVHLDDANFQSEVLESSLPVVVDFWAAWCGPCQMFAPIFEEVSKEYEGRVKFAKLNVEEAPLTADEFQIQSIPTIKIFQNGQEKASRLGAMTAEDLRNWIDEVLF